jgi:hypothetical protein
MFRLRRLRPIGNFPVWTEISPVENLGVSEMLTKSIGACNECLVNYAGSVTVSGRVGLRGNRTKRYSTVEKFWARVAPPNANGCWIFAGKSHRRAGHLDIGRDANGRIILAHRFSWELHNQRRIPKGKVVCHRCDVPTCVNPAHLRLDTQAGNVHESVRKGRKNTWGLQKLTADQVWEIRLMASLGLLRKDIAAAFGISPNHVSTIVHRKAWAHLVHQSSTTPVHAEVAL